MKKWILWRLTQCIATVLFVVGVLGVATAQVPETFTLLNGDSYTVGVRLDSSYDVTRLRQLDLYAGSRKIGYWTGTKAINSAENHFFRFKLSSVTTKGMVGKHQMVVGLKDIVFGQRNYILAYLDIVKTAGFSSGVVLSDGMDLELEVNPAIVNGLANARLTPLVKGYSAYEIAVHNGFTGTESAWLATFTVPKDTAVLARDQALIYKNAAAISAATASTQAINSATSATTATTQAASATLSQQAATTQATNASNSAASATLSQQAAATSATNASNSAASATLSQQAAATSAITASTQAASATTQATNASNSAATATTQAGIATTQATNASNSATAAATSATAAANSATTAATTLASKFNIPTGLTSETLSKWNGTGFTNSLFSDNGTLATIGGDVTVNGHTVGRGGGGIGSNTSFGVSALSANISGLNNVAVGVSALSASTGSENVAIGDNALSTSIGSRNTAIGRFSGRYIEDLVTSNNNTTSSTFIGFRTVPKGSNQSNQIVIGAFAVGLGDNTTVLGNSSTTFGRWYGNFLLGSNTNSGEALQVTGTSKLAGNVSVTGSLTTSADASINGIGIGLGGGSVTSNVRLGNALFQNTTASENTAIGDAALNAITTGGKNTAIGRFSGRYISGESSANTTGTYSTFLGYKTYPLADGQTNQVVIAGNGGVGLGSNTTLIGNPSTATFAVWGDLRLMKGMATAPASSTATCVAGEIRITADYIHVCTSTNTWKRATLTAY